MHATILPARRAFAFAAVIGCLVATTGCVSTNGRTIYTPSQANRALRVGHGTVVGVRSVVIEGKSSQIGTIGGAAVGAAGASTIGSGSGRSISRAVGGAGGAIVGREIEKAVTRKEGLEIHVEMDDGTQLVVVQEASKGGFADGDRVRVITGSGTAVVAH